MYSRIHETFNRGQHADQSDGMTEHEVRRAYETASLLVIDDLGKEKASEWNLATLYAIIDARYVDALPVIITTNYSTEALVEKLTPKDSKGQLTDTTTAKAIIDRLTETCKIVPMTGKSWRTERGVT